MIDESNLLECVCGGKAAVFCCPGEMFWNYRVACTTCEVTTEKRAFAWQAGVLWNNGELLTDKKWREENDDQNYPRP